MTAPAPHPVPPPYPLPAPPGAARRVVLAYNPVAGRFCARTLDRLRAAFEQAGYEAACTSSRDFRLSDQNGPVDTVCIVGGDGTARTIVDRTIIDRNRGAGRDTTFCVYPAGTINLIAREASSPAQPERFVRHQTGAGVAAPHYIGHVAGLDPSGAGRQAFLCCASVGPDAEVVARVTPAMKRRLGRWAYVVAMAGLLWRWPRRRIDVTVDGVAYSCESLFVCKGRYYAGPWVLDEDASMATDTFRVLILDRARRRDMLRLALSAIAGPRWADPRWHRITGRRVTIAGPPGLPLQADGDVLAHTPAVIAVDADPLHFR